MCTRHTGGLVFPFSCSCFRLSFNLQRSCLVCRRCQKCAVTRVKSNDEGLLGGLAKVAGHFRCRIRTKLFKANVSSDLWHSGPKLTRLPRMFGLRYACRGATDGCRRSCNRQSCNTCKDSRRIYPGLGMIHDDRCNGPRSAASQFRQHGMKFRSLRT